MLKLRLIALFILIETGVAWSQETLLLSEVMFQPRVGEAEYVELYNAGDEAVELSDYMIIRWVGDSLGTRYPLPSHRVGARDYVVLTKDAAAVAAFPKAERQKVVECSLPPYPNEGGAVVVATADGTIAERLDYSPAMHSRLLRNKAGVSLERRSFERPCNEAGELVLCRLDGGLRHPNPAQLAEHGICGRGGQFRFLVGAAFARRRRLPGRADDRIHAG